jgi:hypothetical protein
MTCHPTSPIPSKLETLSPFEERRRLARLCYDPRIHDEARRNKPYAPLIEKRHGWPNLAAFGIGSAMTTDRVSVKA